MSKECSLVNAPWWIRVPIGILLLLPIFVMTVGSMSILFREPTEEVSILMLYTLGGAMVFGCVGLLIMNVKMMFGKAPAPDGFSPFTLRIGGIFLLFLPLSGFYTGHYENAGLGVFAQAMFYIFCGFGLFKLASKKAKAKSSNCRENA